MMNDKISDIASKVKKFDRVLIFPHENADGDAMGSSCGFCLALRKLGKDAWVLTSENTAKNLDFLEKGCVTHDNGIFSEDYLSMMVDCSSISRIPGREDAFLGGAAKACIDHHSVTEGDTEFDFGRVEPTSAATGELIYMLVRDMGCEIDLPIADCIFAAVTTDTGNFQHSNTTKRSHEIAGELFDVDGFDCKKVSVLLYDRNSLGSMKLQSEVIENVRLSGDCRAAVGCVTQEMLSENGCTMDEADGIVEKLAGIDGVEIACLLKEKDRQTVKVSMRAKSFANVARVAASHGGGGHVRAAGCTLHETVDEAADRMIAELGEEISRSENE
jgi:phosphoesterase RecJ-like protein